MSVLGKSVFDCYMLPGVDACVVAEMATANSATIFLLTDFPFIGPYEGVENRPWGKDAAQQLVCSRAGAPSVIVGFTRNPIIVPVHFDAVSGFAGVKRRDSRRASIIAVVIVCAVWG